MGFSEPAIGHSEKPQDPESETAEEPIKSIGAVDKSLHGKANPLFIKRLSQRYFSSYSFMIVTQFQYLYANPHNTCR